MLIRTAPLVVVLVLVGLPYPHSRHAVRPGHASVVADEEEEKEEEKKEEEYKGIQRKADNNRP
ncbi:hypothetical protein E2C01_026811 [Portunus trituberculatus]|uniref:Secreted protein n=1 Tax=Portunus trituberculatus TaxID=210409 RepID=A0A5B7EH40_PORTR|nr:hypothetical protein [Portunus trituberculatus]